MSVQSTLHTLFCQKQAENTHLIFNTSSEKHLSKLSKNHQINVIGPTEPKLWPFKDALFNAREHT